MIGKRLDIVPPKPKDAALLTFVLWLVAATIMTPAALFSGQINGIGEFLSIWTGFVTAILLSSLLYFTLRILAGKPLWLAVPSIVIIMTITAMLQTATDFGGQHLLHLVFDGHRLPQQDTQSLLVATTFYWALDGCNIGLLWISSAARTIRLQEVELAETRAARLEAQVNMFRMQVNPHFMGNSLDVVSSLIANGKLGEAQRMADKLASFLRTAAAIEGAETELGEELDMIDAYLDVEASRFGDRLTIEIEHDATLESALIPTFILQPLIDNALKYGVEAGEGAAILRIHTRRDDERLLLIVENIGLAPSGDAAPAGIGFANVQGRLDLLFGREAEFVSEALDNGYRATIAIPYREQEADDVLRRAA
ncbi:sensor histidine kinase [Allosphingosinicella vermicomposti]|uniref:sensor histidine kinase n=1 Tax=Allosphingosinicella vermicomposti TaxID=614671 RepID=UPI000D0EF0ED|nr:histidine kinase [Allosphingosinicella vermicomposti]